MKTVPKIYVGVDVSKNFLDVAYHPTGKHFRVSNNIIGINKMIKRLSSHQVVRIACESSGGYERTMLKLLRKADYSVQLMDPKLIKYFILSKKIKAKTDKIDASMIALFTAHNEPEYTPPIITEKHEELRDMVRRRYAFVEDIAREKKRLKQAFSQKAKNFIFNHIKFLEEQIDLVNKEIEHLIASNSEWKKAQRLLLSMPGFGEISTAALIAEIPELGQIENKQAASILGVAPGTKQSGNFEGRATISGGRFMIRKIIYMAALSASHSKGKFSAYYQRLKNKGKKPKVCLVALMNKMISIANTLLKKGEEWNPAF